jgi:hypothetical protein
MIEQGPASEDAMVLAFVLAEIDSQRFRNAMQAHGLDRASLIGTSDLSDAEANRNRRLILGDVRGFGRGVWLFDGFPSRTSWRQVLVEARDFHQLKCISNDVQWCRLTRGTRLIQEAADKIAANQDIANVDRDVAASVRATVQKIEQGSSIPELVLAEVDGAMVLVEGHKRATAYTILERPFAAFIGTSPSMGNWRYGRDR